MPLVKRVANTYLFENGNIAAFDFAGQQIAELQGSYSIKNHQRILLEAMDNCKFEGFNILPRGFSKTAKDWAEHFRAQNMSWKEIQDL